MSGLLIQAAAGSSGGAGGLRNEPLWVSGVGDVEHHRPGGVQLPGVVVLDGGWVTRPIPEWR